MHTKSRLIPNRDSDGFFYKIFKRYLLLTFWVVGISRQSVIDLEHKNRKITRSILIAMITFFSLRCETALLLYRKGFYSTNFVTSLGFTETMIEKIFDLGEGRK